jgi:signal transduction histidine kinase
VQLEAYEVQKLPVTVTDQGRLEQVLTNLVDNAIKFNEPGGWVRVSLVREGNEALFAVADNGPGIPKGAQEAIFEEFQHGTDVRSRAKEGAGLGLAIARRMIEVLGGRIWVESEPGQGATFYVAIPLETVSDHPAPERAIQPGLPITLGDAHDRTPNTHH